MRGVAKSVNCDDYPAADLSKEWRNDDNILRNFRAFVASIFYSKVRLKTPVCIGGNTRQDNADSNLHVIVGSESLPIKHSTINTMDILKITTGC